MSAPAHNNLEALKERLKLIGFSFPLADNSIDTSIQPRTKLKKARAAEVGIDGHAK